MRYEKNIDLLVIVECISNNRHRRLSIPAIPTIIDKIKELIFNLMPFNTKTTLTNREKSADNPIQPYRHSLIFNGDR